MIPERTTWGHVVVAAEPDRSVPVAHVYVSFLAGSETDPPGEAGLTRLAAQLQRMGTARRTREELNSAIESLGARLDVSVAHHRVSFSGHVLSDSLGPFVDLLEEVLCDPGNRAEDLDKLRGETLASLAKVRDDDQSLAYRHFRDALFRDHPYGRSPAGLPAPVQAAGLEDVVRRQESVIGRSRMVLALAGDLDPDAARPRLEGILARASDGSSPAAEGRDPAACRGVRVRLGDKPGRTQSQVYMGHLGLPAGDPMHFPAVVACTALGGTFSSRMSREIRLSRGWSYGAYARMLRSRHRDAFYMWTFPAIQDMVACIALEIEMLAAIRDAGLEPGELEFARDYLANHFLFAVETPAQRVNLVLKEETLGLVPGFFEGYRDAVRGVGPGDVASVARGFFDPGNIVVSALCTAGRVEPGLRSALGAGAEIEVVPYDSEV